MVAMPGDKEIIQCPHWKDASNLKSDFRDQIIGNHYCALDLTKHDQQVRKEERDRVLKGILCAMNDPNLSICDTGYLEHAYWVDYIKSLRKEQQQ